MLNRHDIIGNLGKDPEVKTLDSGKKMATFSVATSETWTDKETGEKKESTQWHNVILWKGLADIAERFLTKGSQVYISGSQINRTYENKDGVTVYVSELVGKTLKMLSKKSSSTEEGTPF